MTQEHLPGWRGAFHDNSRASLYTAAASIGRALKSLSIAPVLKGGRRRKIAVRVAGPQHADKPKEGASWGQLCGQAPRATLGRGVAGATNGRARDHRWRMAGVPARTGTWPRGSAFHAVSTAGEMGAAVSKARHLERRFLGGVSLPRRPRPAQAAVTAAAAMKAPGLTERRTVSRAMEPGRRRATTVSAALSPRRSVPLHSLAPIPQGSSSGSPARELLAQDRRARVHSDKIMPRQVPDGLENGKIDEGADRPSSERTAGPASAAAGLQV